MSNQITPRSGAIFQELLRYLVKKFPVVAEPEFSLSFSQKFTIGPHPN
jgi:hypothetical protein